MVSESFLVLTVEFYRLNYIMGGKGEMVRVAPIFTVDRFVPEYFLPGAGYLTNVNGLVVTGDTSPLPGG